MTKALTSLGSGLGSWWQITEQEGGESTVTKLFQEAWPRVS